MAFRPVESRSLDEDLYQEVPQLFSAILDTLADTDLFSHSTSPSIFVVYAHDNDKVGIANAWETDLHRLFFHLLRQIYVEAQSLIGRFEDCYKAALERLSIEAATTEGITWEQSGAIVYSEIHKAVEDLWRLDGAALRNEQGRRLVLSDLPTIPYQDHKDRNEERTKGTCEWFTSHQLFRNWQHSKTSSLLWVSADPGCGKSGLAKHLVDNVLPTTGTRTTCYFFKDDIQDQRNLESAMRCLLHQLFVQKPALLTDEILKRFNEDRQRFASFAGLWDIFIGAASCKDAGEIICILDALDECEEGGRSHLARALRNLYAREESKFSLKFLLTSRSYHHIQRQFQTLEDQRPTIHLDGTDETEVEKISAEINIVIKAKVDEIGVRLSSHITRKGLFKSLAKSRSLNLRDQRGSTALVGAASTGQESIVRHLLEKGAKLDIRDNDGQTPLHVAAGMGHVGIVRYLLKKGAKISIPSNPGRTPLFVAAGQGHERMVHYLLGKGVKPDIQDGEGMTPLHANQKAGPQYSTARTKEIQRVSGRRTNLRVARLSKSQEPRVSMNTMM
ncbi:imidazoleglycerol-phosphate dehydratase [Hypoxylon texense]